MPAGLIEKNAETGLFQEGNGRQAFNAKTLRIIGHTRATKVFVVNSNFFISSMVKFERIDNGFGEEALLRSLLKGCILLPFVSIDESIAVD